MDTQNLPGQSIGTQNVLTELVRNFFLAQGNGSSFEFTNPVTSTKVRASEYFLKRNGMTIIHQAHQLPSGIEFVLQVDERPNEVRIYFSSATTFEALESSLEELKSRGAHDFTYAKEKRGLTIYGDHPTLNGMKIEILRVAKDINQNLRTLICYGPFVREKNKNVPRLTPQTAEMLEAIYRQHEQLFTGTLATGRRFRPEKYFDTFSDG